ncbi:MAG: AIR synthase-related protein, partial [Actinomycetota bacterium]
PMRPEVRAVCDQVGIDPYVSISEGTLIATVVPERAEAYLALLAERGIDAAVVGEVVPLEAGRTLVDAGGERALEHPGLDPFWAAFGAWATDAAG